MNVEETSNLLTAIQNVDNRRIDDATVLVWHEIVGDLPFADCLMAVTRHFGESTDYLMPVHVVQGAREIERERIRRADHRRALESARPAERPLKDRSQEIQDFVQSIRDVLPKGDPDSLRYGHRYWREIREARERAATAEPNPHYDPGALAKLAEMAPPPPPSPEGEPHVTTTQPSEKVDD